jgi:hypothetical protein
MLWDTVPLTGDVIQTTDDPDAMQKLVLVHDTPVRFKSGVDTDDVGRSDHVEPFQVSIAAEPTATQKLALVHDTARRELWGVVEEEVALVSSSDHVEPFQVRRTPSRKPFVSL